MNMRLGTFILSLGFLLGISAEATSFYPTPLRQRLATAPLLVRGVVGSSQVQEGAGPDGMVRIYTYTELEVREVLKGTLHNRSIVFREMGGELPDGTALQVDGRAEFSQGEEVLLVLSPPAPDGTHDLLGLQMAKYNIEQDGRGEEILLGAGTRLAAEDQSRTFTLREVRAWIPPTDRPPPQGASPSPGGSTGDFDPDSGTVAGGDMIRGDLNPRQKSDDRGSLGMMAKWKSIAAILLALLALMFLRRASRKRRPN